MKKIHMIAALLAMLLPSVTWGADVTTYDELVAALASSETSVTIPRGTTISAASATTLTIPSGMKLTVYGKLTNVKLEGAGTLAHNWKTITQAAEVHTPFPLGTKGKAGTANGVNTVDGTAGMYLVTSVADDNNVTPACSCSEEFFVTVVNNASGLVYYSTPSTSKPVGVLCTVAREKALNWIDGVNETVYTNYKDLLTAAETPRYGSASNHEFEDTNKLAVLTGNAGTVNSSYISGKSAYDLHFAVDLAGCSMTLNSTSSSKQWNSIGLVRFFNGTVTISQKVMNTNFCVYNMSGSFGYLSGSSYYTAISLYDSPNVAVTWQDMASTTPPGGLNFYGGGKYLTSKIKYKSGWTTKSGFVPTAPKFTQVYWGTFESGFGDPTTYLYNTNEVKAEQDTSQSNAWVVKSILPDPNAGQVLVNGEAESSFADAIAKASQNDVIALQKNIELDADQTLTASGVRIDLNGFQMTGSNAIINNGDLEIIDENGNGKIDVPVINNGTLLLSSAKYNGPITLNSGFCYFLAGTFNGGITVASSVEDAKTVAEVCGGTYTPLTYAHGGQNKALVDLCENGYVKDNAIAPIPVSYVTNPSFASYNLSALDSTAGSLYTRNAARSGYTREEWIDLCKIKAASTMFSGFGVDCAIMVDRRVAANDLSVTKPFPASIEVEIAANNSYSALFQAMRLSGMATAPWTYGSILPGGAHDGNMSFALSNKEVQNGTLCRIDMRLATGFKNMSSPYDWSYTEYVTTATRKLVLGAGTSNKAMIRPATGAATFYATLGAAMDAAADGGTVMLANDCDTALPLNKAGTYTFDTMGFAYSGGEPAVGSGLRITSVTTNAVDSSAKVLVPEAMTITYVVEDARTIESGEDKYVSIEEAVEAASGNTISVTVTANDTETVTLPQGKTLVVTVNDGVEANVTVNPTEGEFVEAETSGTTTTYVSKKITVEMKEPTATVAVTKIDNDTESEVTDAAEIAAVVAKMTGNGDVPRTDNTDKLDVLDKITVTPTKIVEEVKGGQTIIRSATFDVTPNLNAGQSLAEGQKLKFRLPVDAAATQLAAVVYHGDAQFGIYPVQTYNNEEKFVEVESDTFSPYGYELLDGETANPVAAIGTTGYATLAAAVAAVPTDGTETTITMIAGETLASSVTFPANTKIVLDLNGQTIDNQTTGFAFASGTSPARFTFIVNGDLTVKDSATGGNISIAKANNATTKAFYVNGKLTVESGTISADYSAAYVNANAEMVVNGGVVHGDSYGININKSNGHVTINGGSVTASGEATLCTNGNEGIANLGVYDINGGTIENTGAGAAIYNPNRGTTINIHAPAVITGGTGIVMKGGTLNVDGGTISGTGAFAAPSAVNSGFTTTGDALYVEDTYSTGGINFKPTVNITGGTFNSANGYAAQYYTQATAVTESQANGSINISGNPTLTSAKQTDTAASTEIPDKINIAGGSFTHAVPEEYCADGYIPAAQDANTGLYSVKTGSYVAQIGDVKYETFAEAIAAAEAQTPEPVIIVLDTTAVPPADWKFVTDDSEPPVTTLVRRVYVAQVGTTKYENLADAIYAAYNGGTVTLLTDVTVADWEQNVYSLQGATAGTAAGPNGLVIDGNGHSLTVSSLSQNSVNNGAYLLSKGNFTVKNLTVNLPAGATGFAPQGGSFENVTINGGKRAMNLQWTTDTVKIEGCTIANTSSSAFYTEGGTKVAVNDSIFDNSLLSINGTWSFTSNTVKNASADFGSTSVTFRDNDLSEATVGLWADNVDLSENYWGAAGDYESKVAANNRSYTVDSLYTAISKDESGSIQTLSNLAYKVKFVNFDGSTLFATNVVPGGVASYEGATPAKPGDETSAYAFSGWDPATIVAVTDAPQTYTAQFAAATAVAAVFELADGGATTNNYASYSDLHSALEAGKAAGKTVALLADIDLAGVAWTPVGTTASPFYGSIDGNGKTISNLTINDPTLDYAGLIGYGNGGTPAQVIKDLTISNATITARMYVGVLGGCLYANNSINNVTVKGLIQVTGNYMVGGVVGQSYIHAYDSAIVGDEGSFVKGFYLGAKNETVGDSVLPVDMEGDNVGGFIGHVGEGSGLGFYNCSASGLTVMGSRKVGGLVGTIPPENHIGNIDVHDITIGTTATAEYATAKKNSAMEIGGVVGSYYNNGTGGTISGTVQDITIAELPTGVTGTGDDKNISYGLVTGGNRGADPALKGITYSALIAKGYDAEKYNNSYLINNYVATVTDANGAFVGGYETVDDALKAVKTLPGATVNIFAGDYTLTTTSYTFADNVTVVGETDAEGNNLVTINNYLTVSGSELTLKDFNIYAASGNAFQIQGNGLIEHVNMTAPVGSGTRWCYANNGDVTFKNCEIKGGVYGIHFDGGNGQGNVIIEDCTIVGWTSFADTVEKVIMSGTRLDQGGYNYLRFYQDTVISNCSFNANMRVNEASSGKSLIVSDSSVDGKAMASIITEGNADLPVENNYVAVGTRIALDEDGKIVGGVFETIDAALIADGYISIDNPDSETSANYPLTVDGPYVAAIYDENGAFLGGYSTFVAAIDAVSECEEDTLVLKILCDISETASGNKFIYKNLTITTDVAEGVTVNLGNHQCCLDPRDGGVITIAANVKIEQIGQLLCWSSPSVLNVYGSTGSYQLWTFGGATANFYPSARSTFGYGDGMIKMRAGGTINVTGSLAAGQALTADSTVEKQFSGGYISIDGNYGSGYVHSINLTDTYVSTEWLNGTANSTINVILGNSVLQLNASSGFDMGADTIGSVTLTGSRIIANSGTVTINATDTLTMDWKSSITAKNFNNTGSINIDATGITQAAKIIDYTGSGTMALADYGTVNVTGGTAYVDGNDLWITMPPVAEAYDAEGGTLIGQFSTVNEAIAAAGATYVKLLDNVTLTAPLTMTKSYTLDFNGKTIYYNTTATTVINGSSNIIFKNGNLDISSCAISSSTDQGLLIFKFNPDGNILTFDKVELYGKNCRTYGIFSFANSTNGSTVNFINGSRIAIENESNLDYSDIFKGLGSTYPYVVNITDSTVSCTNVTRFSLYGTVNVKDSTVTFTGGENAFRQGAFTFDNSTVTVSGAKAGEGKGLVPRFSDTIVTNGSALTFIGSNIGKDVLFEYANNIVIYDTSTVTAASVSGAAADRAIIAPANYVLVTTDNGGASVTYSVTPAVAQIGDTLYATFADAIAAAETYKAEHGEYPTITVLDATAEQSNPDWKIANGQLVKKVYVAQIVTNEGATTNKYETVEDALTAAQTAGATIEILANSTETPDHALEVLMGGDITLTSSVPVRVEIAPTAKTSSVDTDGMAYIRSASADARCTFTVGANVTLAFPATAAGAGAMYVGYSSANAADMVINGRLELYEPYVGFLSTLTVNPSGSIKSISECLIVRWGATVDIVGTGAEWSDANPQAEFGYVELQGGVTRLKDTYAKGGAWVHLYNRNADKVDQYGATTLALDNSVLATSKINNQAVIELDVDSQIVTPVVQNTGSINIDATGITQAAKVIDYTGSGTMALADYGTVNVTGGTAYVDGNDLWITMPPVAEAYDAEGGTLIGQFSTVNEAIAAAGATYVKLLDNVTLTAPLTMTNSSSYTLDFDGKTIYYNTTATTLINGSSNIIFKNGKLDISGCAISSSTDQGLLIFKFNPDGNILTFDKMELYGKNCRTYGIFSFANSTNGSTVNFINGSRIAIENESNLDYSDIFKGLGSTYPYVVNITDSTVSCTNVTRFSLYGTVNVKGSTVTFTGGENAFRQGAFTFDNSTVTVSGAKAGEGKGLVPRFSDTIVTNGSALTFIGSNIGKDVLFEYANNIVIYDTSTVTAASVSGAAADRAIIAPANYVLVTTDNGGASVTYSVTPAVARIGDTYYATFADAVAAVLDGQTIVVINYNETMVAPEDWKFVTENDVTTLVKKVYVAQIGTAKYESLASAVAAANAGDTIEMIADDRLSSELVIGRSVTITGAVDSEGKPLYTIYGKPTDNYNVDIFVKNASSAVDVTIQNVNISEFGHQYKTSTGNAALYVSRSTHADTHVLVSNVTFSAYNNYAIIAPQGHLEVVDCAIDGYKDSSYGTFATGGIWSGDMFDDLPSSTVSVVRTSIINTDSNMPGVTGYAIDARAGSTVTVTDCTITNVHDGIAAAASQESGDGEASVSVSGTTVTASRNALAITGNPQVANTVLAYLEVTSGMFAGAVTIPDEFVDDGIIEISGGVFDRAVPEDYCATGYVPAANTDAATSAVYPYTVGAAVAQIVRGGNVVAKYESLVAAYNASESGDTIELLGDDLSLSADDNAELTITKSITITGPVDANGDPLYTIYGKNDSNGYNDIFIRAGASDTVTISNVNVAQFGNQASLVMDVAPIYVGGGNAAKVVLDNVHVSEFLRIGVMMSGSGEFEVRNCYIDGERERSDTCSYGIEVHRGAHGVIADTTIENISSTSEGWGAACVTINGQGAVSITNCTLVGGVNCDGIGTSENATEGACTSVVTIEDSTIDADCAMGMNVDGAQFVVKSGTYSGYLGLKDGSANAAPYSISGGMFEYEVPEEFCASGFIPAANTDTETSAAYPYTVKEGAYVAQIGTTKYETFADAIAAADDAVAAGEDDPVIVVIDPTAPQPNDAWKFADNNTKLVRKAYVAQIVRGGEVIAKYESFDEALEAAESGDTIQLLADVTGVTTTYNIEKTLTIDGQGQYAIVAGENTEPRSVVAAWGGSRVMFDMTRSTANITFKDITLDNGEGHYYSFLARVKSGTTTLDNVTLLNGGEADASGTDGVGYGAAVQVDGGTVIVNGDFYADSHGEAGNENGGIFPFTALLYQDGGIHFNDGVSADIGKDLLLVGMEGAVDVSTDAGREMVNEMLEAMNVPAGYYPYTLKLGDSAMTSFTGASPLGWNGIIDYGTDIMNAANTSMGMDLNPDTTPVEVGLLADTVLPETFTYEDNNLTINGNGNAISGTIEYTDDAGTMENIVMGTDDKPLVLDMTGLSEGNAINLGSSIAASNVTIKVTEEQATTLGQAIVTWNAEGESEEDAASLESGIRVEIVDATTGQPVEDPVTGDPMEASIIWDAEMGVAYIGPCEARLTGPTHESPIYTSLASAIARAADSGDTVTLLTNIVNFTGMHEISKSLTLDGAGHKIAAAPVATHRDVVHAWAGSTAMFKLETGNITIKNIELDGDATHAYTFLISADNSSVNLTTENIRLLNGGELCGDANGAILAAGAGYGAAIHLNNGAHLTVKDGFYADTHGAPAEPGQTVGMSDGVFPFTGILPEGGSSVLFDLTEDTNAEPTVEIGKDLLLVGMVGAIDSETAQGILDYMKVPSRFRPYTLTLGDGSAYAFTGASLLGWNEIIEYGKEIMDVSTAVGYEGLDKDNTPVEVGLLTDTVLPDKFVYEDSNFTVNGNGNALSGTIKYTDEAGVIENIVLGTEEAPLVLDLRNVTDPVEIGSLISVSNVTVLMTEEQAQLGQPVFTWNTETAQEPENSEAIKITVMPDAQSEPQGDEPEKDLVWDDELGIAYIGPCEARLTGPGKDPGYMDLTNAFKYAVSGDTITLFWSNVTLNASVALPAGNLLFTTNKYELTLGESAAFTITNATSVFRTELDALDCIALDGDCATGYLIRYATEAGVNVYNATPLGEYIVAGKKADGSAGTANIKVSNEWVGDHICPIEEIRTANVVEDYLNSVDGTTGLRKWEGYVLKQAGPFIITAVDAASDAVTTTLGDPELQETTGFSVKYSLDEFNADGTVKTPGAQTSVRSFTLPVTSVLNYAYYRVRAHLTSGNETLVVDSANEIGVMAVTSALETTIVAVPWVEMDGEDVSVADHMRTATLTPGDTLQVYDSAAGAYVAWELDDNREWKPTTTVTSSGDLTPDDADAYTVPRGAGVWLTRQDTSKPIYLVGGATSEHVLTPLAAAEGGKPSWNIVAAPSVTPTSVSELMEGKSTSDQVVVPAAGAPKNFVYVSGKGWGYYSTEPVIKNGRQVGVKSVFKTNDATISAGTGFFYLNSGSASTIEW